MLSAQLFSHIWLFVTPWTKACSSSIQGIAQGRTLKWVAMSSSRASSQLRDWTCVFCSFCIGRRILYHWGKRLIGFCSVYHIFYFLITFKPFIILTLFHHIRTKRIKLFDSSSSHCNPQSLFSPLKLLHFLKRVVYTHLTFVLQITPLWKLSPLVHEIILT